MLQFLLTWGSMDRVVCQPTIVRSNGPLCGQRCNLEYTAKEPQPGELCTHSLHLGVDLHDCS